MRIPSLARRTFGLTRVVKQSAEAELDFGFDNEFSSLALVRQLFAQGMILEKMIFPVVIIARLVEQPAQ